MPATAPSHFLLAGLAGTAALYGRFEDFTVTAVRERIVSGAASSIPLEGGQVRAVAGDDVLAAYGAADKALRAAIRLMHASRDWCPLLDGALPGLRIALHSADADAAALLAAFARPGEIVVSGKFVAALLRGLPDGCTLLPLSDPGQRLGCPIYRLSVPPEMFLAAGAVTGLRVVYREYEWVIGAEMPSLAVGRDPSNQLVILSRRASRLHGLVEYDDGRFHYADHSSNGSFVSAGGGQEYMLHHDRAELRGKGKIFFGSSGNDPRADYLEFEVL